MYPDSGKYLPVALRWMDATARTASDKCWPTSEDWDAFNSTIGGRLISPKPTGRQLYIPWHDYLNVRLKLNYCSQILC
jgi:hypothetical protein